MASIDLANFDPRVKLDSKGKQYTTYSIRSLEGNLLDSVDRLPYSIRILLENLLRHIGAGLVSESDLLNLASWNPEKVPAAAIPFMPSRVVLQDFTGVPALVDLAALRSAVARSGGDPSTMNPFIPADLVIDHSIQVDKSASKDAFGFNVQMEMERNRERYRMLHWGQEAFSDFRVVPPGTGIVHQVNLEYLASVVYSAEREGELLAYPDSVLGTDSHTTMINGLGVMGWGVGGIEAEAVLLGQPYSLQIPEVVGMRLTGNMPVGTTATDLVLTITQFLREQGVVGRFVEFFGPGLAGLGLADRATIANMAPEYGATMGFFPVDEVSVRYLLTSGRSQQLADLVEKYCRSQALYFDNSAPEPEYTVTYEIKLDEVEPSVSGPSRPQDRLALSAVKADFIKQFADSTEERVSVEMGSQGSSAEMENGSVVIAAITSCTNTSNPDVMVGAGLLAQKAVQCGLQVKPWVKTSMAPGSKVVTRYLEAGNLLTDLETLGFHVVGYGCTTCIGNSGPLDENIANAIKERRLATASVLSGNRNFEARIHPLVQANYLCSPLLVVAYALAGTVLIDLDTEPLGTGNDGKPVFLADIWPSYEEIKAVVNQEVTPDLFTVSYSSVFSGDTLWNQLQGSGGDLYEWDRDSTYIREPPFFQSLTPEPRPVTDIEEARVLAVFGDTITTDHISPAGAIPADSPAGLYLQDLGVTPDNFNSFGSRRGNHEVMMRGTFGNIRIRNKMVERAGGYTRFMPGGEELSIYEAAMRYREEQRPLVIFGGKDYGTGSSRDWAAKGTMLLGVRAVITESFERIHRSNLVGMGVLPLQFGGDVNVASLDIDGSEKVTIKGLTGELTPGQQVKVMVSRADGSTKEFEAVLRLDNETEVAYYRHGGILNKVLRQVLTSQE